MRNENTIYIRPSHRHPSYKWECFVKARGEGAIVGGVSREDAISAAGQILFAINKWGPSEYKSHGPLDTHPEIPKEFNYPIIDES